MKLILTIVMMFSMNLNATQIFDLNHKRSISYDDLLDMLPSSGTLFLGEFHNRAAIQNFQAAIINDHSNRHQKNSQFTLAWEFLDYTDHNKIQDLYSQFVTRQISGDALIAKLFSNSTNPLGNIEYLAPITAAAKNGGQLIGINAPRAFKTELRKKGVDGVDPSILPPNMKLGTDLYLERFKEAMGGHVGDEELKSYFLAQSYTDCVMAHQLEELSQFDLRYLILGSFHSDYFDGTVNEVKMLASLSTTTLKILEKKDVDDEVLAELINGDPKFGNVADYLVVIE